MNNHFAFPDCITGKEIKYFRQYLGLTQEQLADYVGVSKKTVERWEGKGEDVTGPVIRLLRLLWENPKLIDKYSVPKISGQFRLDYYYENILCTSIDVDNVKQIIQIKNYTNKYDFRAFGPIDDPTFEDYENFLESRCFPRTRDKMKLMLEELNLPFYDPLMIIEKTEGRMADDNFHVRIIR